MTQDFQDTTVNRPSQSRTRNWVYTFNNYTDLDCFALSNWEQPKWHYYAHEVAPTTGTPHLQGAFVLHNATEWKTLMKKFNFSFLAPMRGTPQQARAYCAKGDGGSFETGLWTILNK